MPRASIYLQAGYTYHLTHRCHDRQFLLRFARDRNVYREWLREGIRRHRVSVYGYCITNSHVHVVAHADDSSRLSKMMHLAAGSTAKQYNLRKDRMGAMWEHPFHCTRIQDGSHLFRCLCYVDLNMVRAGVVHHPREWEWCGYHDLVGKRIRYRVVDLERLLASLGDADLPSFRDRYEESLAERIEKNRLSRESYWTESIAVGSKTYVDDVRTWCTHRTRLQITRLGEDAGGGWSLREERGAYG